MRSWRLILLAFLVFTATWLRPFSAQAQHRYASCCLCVFDEFDQKGLMGTQRECDGWLTKSSKRLGCAYQESVSKTAALTLHLRSAPASCEKVEIYGAFHGSSSGSRVPFEISAAAAKSFSAKEVCYDGSTCLLFDNVDQVQACAQQLGQYSACKFKVSANQNIGVTGMNCWGFFPEEVREASSKLTAIVDGLNFHLQYAECSKPGDKCSYKDPTQNSGSNNDPNTKFCRRRNAVTSQTCCLPAKGDSGDTLNGRWSIPGLSC